MARRIVVAALMGSVIVPAGAQAATVTVKGDDGNPLALAPGAGPTLRTMDADTEVVVAAGETRTFSAQVFDAAGTPAGISTSCTTSGTSAATARQFFSYRGNGAYRLRLTFFPVAGCTGPPSAVQDYGFTIAAGTGVQVPAGPVLTRDPNSVATKAYELPFAINPGASAHEIRTALGGVVGPDGAISGGSQQVFENVTTGRVTFRFERPGRHVIVARASADQFFTPWSAPAFVTAIAPFDFESVRFPDSRGPRYRLLGQIRETSARGRVAISVARGSRGGRFRRLGSARIRSNGQFSLRFGLRRTGVYRLRYRFRGSATVAPGAVVERIRVSRRVFFGPA